MYGVTLVFYGILGIIFVGLMNYCAVKSSVFSATLTPLASIIGSGFLVSVPLLAGSMGIWAVLAIVSLVVFAFLLGGALRYNIAYGEPLFDTENMGYVIESVRRVSHVLLIGAYFVSVAYYLILLSIFSMELFGINNPFVYKSVASATIFAICITGMYKGLKGVEKAEKITVSMNLAAILILLLALTAFSVNLPDQYSWRKGIYTNYTFTWHNVGYILGILIIVQGFETTRFMGQLYDRKTRIAAMKWAQGISALVYSTFFVLMIPLFPYFTQSSDIARFIDVIARVSPWLPFVIIFGAIGCQFSAAVSDSIGASGLIGSMTKHRIPVKHSYIFIAVFSNILIWGIDVIAIMVFASRAFALFYCLQCALATILAKRNRAYYKMVFYGFLSVLCLGAVVFGIPVPA